MGERIFFEGIFEAMCVQLGKVYQTQMHFFNSKQCLPVEEMLLARTLSARVPGVDAFISDEIKEAY